MARARKLRRQMLLIARRENRKPRRNVPVPPMCSQPRCTITTRLMEIDGVRFCRHCAPTMKREPEPTQGGSKAAMAIIAASLLGGLGPSPRTNRRNA